MCRILALEKRHVTLLMQPVRKIRSIAVGRHRPANALKLAPVHAENLEIERISLIPSCNIGIAHHTNYD